MVIDFFSIPVFL